MLKAWQNFFIEVDPDIVIGYNITQFDIPYLLQRAWALKLSEFPFMGRLKGEHSKLLLMQMRCLQLTCVYSISAEVRREQRAIQFLFVSRVRRTLDIGRVPSYSRTLSWTPRERDLQTQRCLPTFPWAEEGRYRLCSNTCPPEWGCRFSEEPCCILYEGTIIVEILRGLEGCSYIFQDVYLPLRLFEKLKCFEKEVKEAKAAHVPFNAMRVWRNLKDVAKRYHNAIELQYVLVDKPR